MRGVRAAFVTTGVVASFAAALACTSFTADPSGADDGGDAGEGSVAADAASAEARDTGPAPAGASCREILAAHPERAGLDGVYPRAPIGDGGQSAIFCDMSIEGGGWTLVARSAAGTSEAFSDFGWNRKTGDLADPAFPYSLDAVGVGLVFDQVLVAERAGVNAVGPIAYRFKVKPDFLAARNVSVDVRPAVLVRGSCDVPGGPQMLRFAGATANDNNFFLRDIAGTDIRNGLDPGGFDLAYDTCEKAGLLDGKQGVIFVR